MKRAWLVIGESNSKKSTAIRCLTGISTKKTLAEIETPGDSWFRVRAAISAMQEMGWPPAQMLEWLEEQVAVLPSSEEDETEELTPPLVEAQNVILPLRLLPTAKNNTNTPCPHAHSYINALVRRGWQIECIACLGGSAHDDPHTDFERIRLSGFRYFECFDSWNLPGTVVAHKLRTAFDWH